MGQYHYILHEKDFETQVLDSTRFFNPVLFIAGSSYIFIFVHLFFYITKLHQIAFILLSLLAIMSFLAIFVIPNINHFVTYKMSQDLEEKENLTPLGRTKLVKRLMQLPLHLSLQYFAGFCIAYAMFAFSAYIILRFNIKLFLFIAPQCGFCAYLTSVFAYIRSEKICAKFSTALVKKGLDNNNVNRIKVYGMKQTTRVLFHIFVPTTVANIIQLASIIEQNIIPIERGSYLVLTTLLLISNTALCITYAVSYYNHIAESIKTMNGILEQINSMSIANSVYVPTDLGTEIAYSIYITNNLINTLQSIMKDVKDTGEKLLYAAQNLSVTSNQTASTALAQAETVNNCVATMNSIKDMLNNVSENINNVAREANNTSFSIHEGSDMLKENIKKITEITQANLDTITGIKQLSEKIDSVWSIISTIDSIAEKTKNIAFNAEIEATTAGESGENFHIVANEIRRLASTITDSTREIRSRITGIQHSSDNLIITSEGGTEKIREGSILFTNLENNFENLLTSSEITTESASDIKDITDTLDSSFVQISCKLEDIKNGCDKFTASAQTISHSADNIKTSSILLNSIQTQEEV